MGLRRVGESLMARNLFWKEPGWVTWDRGILRAVAVIGSIGTSWEFLWEQLSRRSRRRSVRIALARERCNAMWLKGPCRQKTGVVRV